MRGKKQYKGLRKGRLVAQVSTVSGEYLYTWYPDDSSC